MNKTSTRRSRPARTLGFGLALALWGGSGMRTAMAEDARAAGPSAYLGDDILWRPRENLLFHLLDADGGGFSLRFT